MPILSPTTLHPRPCPLRKRFTLPSKNWTKINQIIYFNYFYQSEIKKSALLFQRIQGNNKLFPNTKVLKYLYLKNQTKCPLAKLSPGHRLCNLLPNLRHCSVCLLLRALKAISITCLFEAIRSDFKRWNLFFPAPRFSAIKYHFPPLRIHLKKSQCEVCTGVNRTPEHSHLLAVAPQVEDECFVLA